MHKLKKIVVAMSLIVPVSAYPLGVGELKLNSALNESLSAEISLSLAANEDINAVSITMASPEKFDEAGISWHYFLSGVRFNKVSKGNNKYVIELTSNNRVQEPFLDFLLEVKWPNGNIFKSFTVLVDPATDNQNDFIEPVQAPLKKIKRPVYQAKKAPQFVENDLSSLSVEGMYGPTKRNDSLWKVAEKINQNKGQSVEQVMMALYKANPRAFYKKNVNALMEGKTLKIPSDVEINSLSKKQASTEFYFQYDVWTGKRKLNSKPTTVVAADKKGTTDKKKDKQLILVSPVNEDLEKSEALAADTGKQLKLINKNEELQERLALLEEKFSIMQKMLAVKDKELAALQDARFSAELDEIEEKDRLAKEKKEVTNDVEKPELIVKDKVVAQAKVEQQTKEESKPEIVQPTAEIVEKGVSYLNMMLGSLALLLVAIAGFFALRKRQVESESNVENIFKATDNSVLPDNSAVTQKEEVVLNTSNEASFTAKVTEHPKVKEEVVDDVLLDADTYLAYGKYDEAENALRQELKASPDKDSYKLKLLEVFYSSENNAAFDDFVQELIQEGKRSDVAFWRSVSAMGQDFSSHLELFSDDIIRDDNPEFDLNIDEEIDTSADKVEVTEFELDNDNILEKKDSSEPEKLDIDSFEFTPSTTADEIEEFDSNPEKLDLSEPLEMIDFSIDKTDKEELDNISITEPEDLEVFDMELGDEGMNFDSDPDIDLSEFSLSDEAELTDELNVDASSVTVESDVHDSVENNDEQLDDFDFDFSVEGDASYTPPPEVKEGENGDELILAEDDQKLTLDANMIAEINDTGDYETNLDLAKMYVAMGETDAAKELAEDVLANGSDEQKKEAKEVLDHISS